ncbi:MAG: metallophosphoesterase [Candidatus Aenigmatarchaeota archaeon]
MKTIIIGDPHVGTEERNFEPIERIIKRKNPDNILCTGDLETYKEFDIPFYFISGNHEDFDLIEKIDSGEEYFRNLKHIKNGEIIEIGDLRISSLNGNYSPKRYDWDRKNLKQDRRRHFVKSDVKKCLNIDDIDIFISHEAPSGIGVTKGGQEAGIQEVREIIEEINPEYHFFGHFHFYHKGKIGKTEIYGLPKPEKGYIKLKSDGESFKLNSIIHD